MYQKRKGENVYLTQDEFIVLSALKMCLNNAEIFKNFKLQLGFNDPRLGALCLKYGAKNKQELLEKSNLKKVEVTEIENMPYFQYETMKGAKVPDLVRKIKITKNDFLLLSDFFKSVNEPDKEFELIWYEDFFNIIECLEIKDTKTNEKYELKTIIDGYGNKKE